MEILQIAQNFESGSQSWNSFLMGKRRKWHIQDRTLRIDINLSDSVKLEV